MNTTEAIVLHLQKYNDKASIVHLLTRDRGRVPFMVYGLSKGKKAMIYSPFAHIEIEYNDNKKTQFFPMKSANLKYIPQNIQTDIRRQTILLFLAEILYRTYSYPMPDESLFDYLTQFLQDFDHCSQPQNAHICFLLTYAGFLGIAPDLENETTLFTMQEIEILQSLSLDNEVLISRKERQSLLEKLCRYYELHLSGFTTPVSLQVLREVFD